MLQPFLISKGVDSRWKIDGSFAFLNVITCLDLGALDWVDSILLMICDGLLLSRSQVIWLLDSIGLSDLAEGHLINLYIGVSCRVIKNGDQFLWWLVVRIRIPRYLIRRYLLQPRTYSAVFDPVQQSLFLDPGILLWSGWKSIFPCRRLYFNCLAKSFRWHVFILSFNLNGGEFCEFGSLSCYSILLLGIKISVYAVLPTLDGSINWLTLWYGV